MSAPEGRSGAAQRQFTFALAVCTAVGLGACADTPSATSSAAAWRPRAAHLLTAGNRSCLVRDTSTFPAGYHGWLEPNEVTVCGTTLRLWAIPDSGNDYFGVWWYGPLPGAGDSSWALTASDGMTQPLFLDPGEAPLHYEFDAPVTNVEVLWQMSPRPGSKVEAFDVTGALLGEYEFGSNTQPSTYAPATHEIHTFSQRGIRRVKVTAAPGAPILTSSKMWIQVWFEPDTAPKSIRVVCDKPIRGANVTCTATPRSPGDQLTLTAWRFNNAAGDVVNRDPATAGSSQWIGALADSGTIAVEGTINSRPAFGDTSVAPIARDWASVRPDTSHKMISPGRLSPLVHLFEEAGNAYHILGPGASSWWVSIDDDGPNNGFWYLAKFPTKFGNESQLNDSALYAGSPWYNLQGTKKKKTKSGVFCARSVIPDTLKNLTIKHEGFTPDPMTWDASHPAVFFSTADSVGRRQYEPLAASSGRMPALVLTVNQTVYNQAVALSHLQTDSTRNYVTNVTLGGCLLFNYF